MLPQGACGVWRWPKAAGNPPFLFFGWAPWVSKCGGMPATLPATLTSSTSPLLSPPCACYCIVAVDELPCAVLIWRPSSRPCLEDGVWGGLWAGSLPHPGPPCHLQLCGQHPERVHPPQRTAIGRYPVLRWGLDPGVCPWGRDLTRPHAVPFWWRRWLTATREPLAAIPRCPAMVPGAAT